MKRSPASLLFLCLIPAATCPAANLAYSTYLRYGFTPSAMTSDAQGNLYVAGSAIVDPVSRATSAVVAKLDPTATRYLYLEYQDSAAGDMVGAIAVDAAGNLYVTGTTSNPNFPVTASQLGAPPTGPSDTRAFLTKLNPAGVVLLSALIGGSAVSTGLGIAVTPQGQILVSGISGAGFAATPGAFHVPDTTGKWFLVELDAAASKMIFAATGVGGSSVALDAAGNIFAAGSSLGTDYPTTPGAYQQVFVQGYTCYGFCRASFAGQLQHLTKLDPTGSRLIYSTGINDSSGRAGSTVNTGLAVDAAGNAYITGTLLEAQFPFTVDSPIGAPSGFLTKVNAAGNGLVFSIPVGGAGVALDSAGGVYTAGTISTYSPIGFPGLTPSLVFTLTGTLGWIPQGCVPNTLTSTEAAYLMKLDSTTGMVLDAQWLSGSSVTASAVTFAGSKLWSAGLTLAGDVPITPGALADTNILPGSQPGAFLSAADFSKPPAQIAGGAPQIAGGAPTIACVLDAGNFMPAGPVSGYQILSIFGANLGPSPGVSAPDGTDPTIAGVTVTFDGLPAKMSYVSSSQINVMVPGPAVRSDNTFPQSTVMQLSVNGQTIQRQFAWTFYNLNVFADIAASTCPGDPLNLQFQAFALNPDGSRNSCKNPAKLGSLVSLFVHGVGAQQLGLPMPDQVFGLSMQAGSCPVNVEKAVRTGIVYKVDLRLLAALAPCGNLSTSAVTWVVLTTSYNGQPVGPLIISAGPITPLTPVREQQIRVWVSQ